MDPSSEMSVFVEVVRQGGFSAAARTLNRTPSAVSKQISRLEDRLGVRLLNRTTRQLNMTEEGEAYFDRAAVILADIMETEAMVANQGAAPRGLLRVTCSTTFGRQKIVPVLPEFLTRYPELRMQLSLSDTLIDLVQDGFDVALRMGELNDSSLVARRLALIQRLVCAAPSYIEKHGLPEHPEQLSDHNCLVHRDVTAMNDWAFRLDGDIRKIHVGGSFESNSAVAIHEAALAGLGVAQMASFVAAPDLKAGRLVSCLDKFVDSERPIYAVYPHRRHLTQKVRVFIDYLVDHFAATPP
ncbi:MAG: LysR family transcriptional regulator [Rhodospirillaceae bacterium]|jgi:DNA-binding transcriptional LysR family regulator|nr:LysR family transcriptional regulator [Rhodospirillaceae bacterium]MBT5810196.1 LysR family transcriptional regulator [Rhodospirillaceae bacterium]